MVVDEQHWSQGMMEKLLGFIAYDDVYITIGVNICSRKILDSCMAVFLSMIVSFIMYLVRDYLINKWNQLHST